MSAARSNKGPTAGAHRRGLSAGQRLTLLIPYLWLVVFFLAPFAIVVKISLSQAALTQPPYTPVFDLSKGVANIVEQAKLFSFDAYRGLFEDWLYIESYLSSLRLAFIATLLTLVRRLSARLCDGARAGADQAGCSSCSRSRLSGRAFSSGSMPGS